MIVESIGIIATLIVLASFITDDLFKIRILNAVGSIVFVIYGILIGSISVWVLNGILMLIHLYKIIRKVRN